jgi:hypothetical protein
MAQYSITTLSNLFKTKFGPLSEATYNSKNAVLARIKKNYNFVGDVMTVPVPNSFGGGVGSGSLPTANAANTLKMTISAKKMYATVQIDRESIKASQNDEGAYVKLLAHSAKKGVESWMRNLSRALFNDGTGALGTVDGNNAGGSAAAPTVVITAATWKEANWEEYDYVNVNSDSTVFEVTAVAPATRTITLARISGSADLTSTGANDVIYMQNSKDNDPEGLKGVLDATSSTKYGVTIGRRFQATQKAASSAAITEDMLNEVMLDVEKKTGQTPNLIVASYTQYRKLLAIFQSAKRYPISPRDNKLKGVISLDGIEFASTRGPVPVITERFVEDDRIYLLNDDFIEIHHRPDFGWFDDDGTVFLRDSTTDSYSARYGGYLQIVIVPTFHGVITGLAT